MYEWTALCQSSTSVTQLQFLFWHQVCISEWWIVRFLRVEFMMQQCPSPSPLVSLLTRRVEYWPLSLTLGNLTGACQSRSLGPVMTTAGCPSVRGLSMSSLTSSVPFWPKIQADPIHGQHRTIHPAGPHQSSTHPQPAGPVPPHSLCLLHNHSRSPSHSAASNRKPAISNLTHFSDC